MKSNSITFVLIIGASFAMIANGCSDSGNNHGNPVVPEEEAFPRMGMHFPYEAQIIFGSEEVPATEVDMATIQWDFYPVDGFKWVVAVGTEDPPGGAETDPS